MPVRLYLTDQVALEIEGRILDDWRRVGRQGRLIFVILAAEHLRAVPADELADETWGDELPESWERALSALVSKLRALLMEAGLPGSILASAFGGYQLHLPPDAIIDIEAAAQAIDHAEGMMRSRENAAALGWATVAYQVARRSFLSGEDGSWVVRKRAELRDVLVRAHESLSELILWNGEPVMAVWHAEQAVLVEPYRETGYRLLMRAHAGSGNRGSALRTYERCRKLLREELGVSPSPETEAVHREILSL